MLHPTGVSSQSLPSLWMRRFITRGTSSSQIQFGVSVNGLPDQKKSGAEFHNFSDESGFCLWTSLFSFRQEFSNFVPLCPLYRASHLCLPSSTPSSCVAQEKRGTGARQHPGERGRVPLPSLRGDTDLCRLLSLFRLITNMIN